MNTNQNPAVITPEFIEILRNEGNRAWSTCLALNADMKYDEVPEDDTLEKAIAELYGLIGLDSIKKNDEDLTNFLKVQKIRKEKELEAIIGLV